MSLPKFLSGLQTENFDHVAISLSEFAAMLKTPKGYSDLKPARDRFAMPIDPRFTAAHLHLKADPVIPQDVRDEAAKHSRELVWSLDVFKSKIVRGQSHGSLDSSRLARLASPGIAPREFERLAMTAYRRREHVQAVTTRPRIAFVADMNNEIRSANPTYMRTLGRLAYVVGEAAKLSGVEVSMIGSRGWSNSYAEDIGTGRRLCRVVGHEMRPNIPRPHLATVVKGWNDDMTGAEYALFTDATQFAASTMVWGTLNMATPVGTCRGGMTSDCGAGGIEFARSQGANMVIAFGKFDAAETADLILSPSASVETVVHDIVATLAHGKAA